MKRLVTEEANEWQPWEDNFRYWCSDLVIAWSRTSLALHTNITEGGL